jgi:hypothetical protein
VEDEAGEVLGAEEQVGPERRHELGTTARAERPPLVVPGRHLPTLVELPVGREVRLRHHAQHVAAVDDERGVVDPVAVPQWRAGDEHGDEAAGTVDHRPHRNLDGVEQGVLQDDVLDRVARPRELGEHGEHRPVPPALLGGREHALGVARRLGDAGRDRARRDTGEPARVDRPEPVGHR